MLSQAPQPRINPPGTAAIRTDVDVPVLMVETETDVGLLGYFSARQDDSRHVRLWEVAGTTHGEAVNVQHEKFETKLVGWFNEYSKPSRL